MLQKPTTTTALEKYPRKQVRSDLFCKPATVKSNKNVARSLAQPVARQPLLPFGVG